MATIPDAVGRFNTSVNYLLFCQLKPLKERSSAAATSAAAASASPAAVTAEEYASIVEAFTRIKALYTQISDDKSTSMEPHRATVQATWEHLEKKIGKAKERYLTPASPSSLLTLVKKAETEASLFIENSEGSLLRSFFMDSPTVFEFGGVSYPTALHAFYAQMYPHDVAFQRKISEEPIASLPQLVLLRGDRRADWLGKREEILFNILRAKIGQNTALKATLLATLNTYLFYPGDSFWGIGEDGKGANRIGIFLMRLRSEMGGVGGGKRPDIERVYPLELPAPLKKEPSEILSEITALNESASAAIYAAETTTSRSHDAETRCPGDNFAFDRTLVPLSSGAYINANYLYGKTMIGTQAPMHSTEENFWRMIVEQKCKGAVMLNGTDEYGDSYRGTYTYFPTKTDEPRVIGPVTIRLLEPAKIYSDSSWGNPPFEEKLHGICCRKLEITVGEETHTVEHFQYINWPDRDVGNPYCIIKLIELTKGLVSLESPLLIHCAAGVGRTATFACILEQAIALESGRALSIKDSVASLRGPETGRFYKMVQSAEQYASCYRTLQIIARGGL